MLLELCKGSKARLVATAAVFMIAFGAICTWVVAAQASDSDPQIYKMDVAVDAPVVGAAPAPKCTVTLYKQDGTVLSSSDDVNSSWRIEGDDGAYPDVIATFESGKTYTLVAEEAYMHDGCPGFAESALGFVNGKPSNPQARHESPSSIHMIRSFYSWTLHEVTFHSNNGSDDSSTQTVYEGEENKLNKNTFTKDGSVFAGWNTKADGSGTAYADEAIVDFEESVDLYAQWTKEPDPSVDPEPSVDPDPEVDPKPTVVTKKMYRLYNPNSGEHFYTADPIERLAVVAVGWIPEGVGWMAPQESSVPVFRLYNAVGGEHHYTMSADERDYLVQIGWSDEGIGWYSDDEKSVPLYREYNPNAFSNNHNYTADAEEHGMLIDVGWNDEGVAWYGCSSQAVSDR